MSNIALPETYCDKAIKTINVCNKQPSFVINFNLFLLLHRRHCPITGKSLSGGPRLEWRVARFRNPRKTDWESTERIRQTVSEISQKTRN